MVVQLQGEHIKNHSDTLVVILQGVFTKTNEAYADKVVRGEISDQAVKTLHGYYHFRKVSERNKERDYFYLQDYYSSLYGWYLFDHGRFIYQELSFALSKFIQEHDYRHVYVVGSSKGGAGAIILALHCPEVEKVFTMVPDLKISTDAFGASGRALFFNNDPIFEKQVKTIFENQMILNELEGRDKKPTFFYFTGVRDYGFKAITNFHRKLQEKFEIESHLLVMPTPEPHSPLIKNHPNLMNHLIQSLDKKVPWEEDEFTSVSPFVHIATYKSIGMK